MRTEASLLIEMHCILFLSEAGVMFAGGRGLGLGSSVHRGLL